MEMTSIIPSCPGYMWKWQPVYCGQWYLTWEPIANVYSPPLLHPDMKLLILDVPSEYAHNMGRVIGKEGRHLKEISFVSGAPYIFFRKETSQFEIWGTDACTQHAYTILQNWLNRMLKK